MAISMTISTLNSYPPFKPCLTPFKSHKFRHPIPQFTPCPSTQSSSSRLSHVYPKLVYSFNAKKKNIGFCLNSKHGQVQVEGESGKASSNNELEYVVESSLPDRFKLTPPWVIPDWPYFLALAFLLYSGRAIIWEVGNWRKAALAIGSFLTSCLKFILAPVANPLTFLIKVIETSLYSIRAFYSGIINYAPIGDLTLIIMLASIVFAIAETSVPDSMNSQPYIMTFAGILGYSAVRGLISEPFFWTLLLVLFSFSRFIKKKDYVSSTLPVAAVLVAVGEPRVRLLSMVSFTALAINHYWNNPTEEKEQEPKLMGNSLPFPLLCAGLAIGLRVAVKWAGYRHLTWMVV